jgi:hypothetical protein
MTKKRNDPIEQVELKISIRASRATSERIRSLVPSAKLRKGSCELRVAGESPGEVAQKAEEMMETLREVLTSTKDFKTAEGSLGKK